jgi:hypothetical protein
MIFYISADAKFIFSSIKKGRRPKGIKNVTLKLCADGLIFFFLLRFVWKEMRAAYSVGVVITGTENALFVMFGCALSRSFHFRHSRTVSEHFSFFLL